MKSHGARYSPTFKFQVVLEASKAERKGTEAQVARAYGGTRLHWPMEEAHLKGESVEKRMKGRHVSTIIITHHA